MSTPSEGSSPWASLRRPPRPLVNPFDALEVQLALARLERQIAELDVDDGRFARAHHLHAARLAFDQVLDQACRLAGVGPLPDVPGLRRVIAEAELRARGWDW